MEQVSIQTIAKWFLSKEPMSHKKLQKVCYYAVGWAWALMDRNIISDDRFEAWVHGPVAPTLYDTYKRHGWNNIPSVSIDDVPSIPNDVFDLLESVWLTYGDKSGNELEALSHSEKPWREARKGLPDSEISHEPINPATMRNFYNSIKTTEY